MSGTCGRGRRILQVDEDRRLARGRVALQVVEIRRLLELALEAVGDLLERVADRCAWPSDLHDHGLDGEVRILAPAEPQVGADARHHDDEHEIDHERTMPDRPFGEVEVHQTDSQEADFLTGAQRLHAGGDHDFACFQALRDHDGGRIVSHDFDVAQGYSVILRIDHPDGRASACFS